MKNFEEKLEQSLKEEYPLSKEARFAFEEAYTTIAKKNTSVTKKARNFWRKQKLMLTIVSTALIMMILSISPIGSAIANYLQFGQFTSKTLKTKGFVTKQNSQTITKEIQIAIKEVYADTNEIGIHFAVELSQNSKLANKKIDQYALNFALKNADGNFIFDLNSGLSHNALTSTGSFSGSQHYDKKTNQLDLYYRYHTSDKAIPALKNSKVILTSLTGNFKRNDKPGFSYQKEGSDYEKVTGYWELPIKTSQIKPFPTLKYKTITNSTISLTAHITPTTFTVIVPHSFETLKNTRSDEIYLTATSTTKNSTQIKYPLSSINVSKTTENEDILTFDYPAYDTYQKITLHLGKKNFFFQLN